MMKSVAYSKIEGKIKAPSSKSMMQRAIAASLLAKGQSKIFYPSFCEDSQASMRVAQALGAKIQNAEGMVIVEGGFAPVRGELDCGEAGLCIRMFAPIAALFSKEIKMVGHGSLLKRPLDMIEKPLQELGAICQSNHGYLPLQIQGPLKGGKAIVDGSVSSQFLTGLLVALPTLERDTELTVLNLKSKPYIDMTLQVLEDFGIQIHHSDYERFFIQGNQKYKAHDCYIEGDWSGAAFMLVAAAIAGKACIDNLIFDSRQADRKILDVLQAVGAYTAIQNDSITIAKKNLKSFVLDATECPDLFPPLVALAAHCDGVSRIAGLSRLEHKESNRGMILQKEFAKIGIKIGLEEDTMLVYGGTVCSGKINSHHDHRIAMAGAIAALNSTGKIEIENAEAVAKSYGDFFQDLSSLGAEVTLLA